MKNLAILECNVETLFYEKKDSNLLSLKHELCSSTKLLVNLLIFCFIKITQH